jgi:preprotein translocase subunit SecE
VARNDDAAARRRAKRRGEDLPADEAAEAVTPAPEGATGDDVVDAVFSDEEVTATQHAENVTRAGISGAPIDMAPPTEFTPQTDFDPAPGGEVVGGEVTTAGGGPRVLRFFKASWAELQRVRWPDRQQVAQGTAVTLGFVVIAGAYLGLADVVARQIVNLII